jgi:hypothetical protein
MVKVSEAGGRRPPVFAHLVIFAHGYVFLAMLLTSAKLPDVIQLNRRR